MSAVHELNRALAAALGLPKLTTRAVLTLEVGKLPRIELDVLCADANERPFLEPAHVAGDDRTMLIRLAPKPTGLE